MVFQYRKKIQRDPAHTHAYLVGGGIASLAAAAHLLLDAHVPASQIHILEAGGLPGGSMDGVGDPHAGYIARGGRMLNFTYRCTYSLLSRIPSLTDQSKSVLDEITAFNAIHKTHANARLVANGEDGKPDIIPYRSLGFSTKDKLDLIEMTVESEGSLGTKKIEDCFSKDFFETDFWFMWATT